MVCVRCWEELATAGKKTDVTRPFDPQETGVEHVADPIKPIDNQPAVSVVPIDSLIPDAANVRKRDGEAERMLEASVRQFGAGRSLVLDGKDIVRAGNGTLKAAKAAGKTEVLVVEPKPGQIVAVKRSDWSATEATAYAIADNQLATRATWDDDGLASQIEAIQADGFIDFDALGFSGDDLGDILGGLQDQDDLSGGQEEEREDVLPEKWMVVIECQSEQQQVELLERFKAENLECRAFIS
jgi:hypothetical protein